MFISSRRLAEGTIVPRSDTSTQRGLHQEDRSKEVAKVITAVEGESLENISDFEAIRGSSIPNKQTVK
jgi:hypothetical protein